MPGKGPPGVTAISKHLNPPAPPPDPPASLLEGSVRPPPPPPATTKTLASFVPGCEIVTPPLDVNV